MIQASQVFISTWLLPCGSLGAYTIRMGALLPDYSPTVAVTKLTAAAQWSILIGPGCPFMRTSLIRISRCVCQGCHVVEIPSGVLYSWQQLKSRLMRIAQSQQARCGNNKNCLDTFWRVNDWKGQRWLIRLFNRAVLNFSGQHISPIKMPSYDGRTGNAIFTESSR